MTRVKVAYFSGTGGTRRIAECAVSELEKNGCTVDLERIDAEARTKDPSDHYDLLVFVSVVHEFNFPQPVREWASALAPSRFAQAAVFSVSGGGNAVGNRGAQRKTIEELEQKGVIVTYDEVFVMPSNFFYSIKHPVDAMEMAAYPAMVKHAIENVLAGKAQRHKTPLLDKVVTRCFQNSWKHTHRFGSAIEVSDTCTSCGVCVRVCPADNIQLDSETKHPRFEDRCVFCLGCLYACPASALHAGRDKYALIKEGYDLNEIEQRSFDPSEWEHVEALCKGYLYSGVKPYLVKARALLFPNEYSSKHQI